MFLTNISNYVPHLYSFDSKRVLQLRASYYVVCFPYQSHICYMQWVNVVVFPVISCGGDVIFYTCHKGFLFEGNSSCLNRAFDTVLSTSGLHKSSGFLPWSDFCFYASVFIIFTF
jgi:hypothetical protein